MLNVRVCRPSETTKQQLIVWSERRQKKINELKKKHFLNEGQTYNFTLTMGTINDFLDNWQQRTNMRGNR